MLNKCKRVYWTLINVNGKNKCLYCQNPDFFMMFLDGVFLFSLWNCELIFETSLIGTLFKGFRTQFISTHSWMKKRSCVPIFSSQKKRKSIWQIMLWCSSRLWQIHTPIKTKVSTFNIKSLQQTLDYSQVCWCKAGSFKIISGFLYPVFLYVLSK